MMDLVPINVVFDRDGPSRTEMMIAPAITAASPYVAFLFVPFVWIFDRVAGNGGSDGYGRSCFNGRIDFCRAIAEDIGFGCLPYVAFLCVPFVWIWEKIGVTAAWNNATRILGRVSASLQLRGTTSSNRGHPTNGVYGDIEALVQAEEVATKRKFQLKILLMLAFSLITLAFAVPFGVMSTNDGRMTQLSEELTLIIALGVVFLCLVIILLLFFWGMRCIGTATFICLMGTSLFLGLAVVATLAALHRL